LINVLTTKNSTLKLKTPLNSNENENTREDY
jgi:hypothetical protein